MLIVLGAVIAVHPAWVERYKARVGGSLIVLGLAALVLTGIQDSHEIELTEKRDKAVKDLHAALYKQAELELANSKLQVKNLEIAEENRKLASETLRVAMGDPDNPPYLYLVDFNFSEKPARSQLYIVNSSKKYAAHGVTASLSLDRVPVTTSAISIPPGSRAPAAFPSRFALPTSSLNIPQLEAIGAQVTFESLIGTSYSSFAQLTGVVRSPDGKVRQAIQLARIDDRSKIVFSAQDDGFPKNFAWQKPATWN